MSTSTNNIQSQNFGSKDHTQRLSAIEVHYEHMEKDISNISKDIKTLAKEDDLKDLSRELKELKDARLKTIIGFGIAVGAGILSNILVVYIFRLIVDAIK